MRGTGGKPRRAACGATETERSFDDEAKFQRFEERLMENHSRTFLGGEIKTCVSKRNHFL
jgi:hypothetical protein